MKLGTIFLTLAIYAVVANANTNSEPNWANSLATPLNFYHALFSQNKPTVLFLGEYHKLVGHKETLTELAQLAGEGVINRVVFEQILGSQSAYANAYLADKEAIADSWVEAYYFCKITRVRKHTEAPLKIIQTYNKKQFKAWYDQKISTGQTNQSIRINFCGAQGLQKYFRLFREAKKTNRSLQLCGMELFLQDATGEYMTREQEIKAESLVLAKMPKPYIDLARIMLESPYSDEANVRDLYMAYAVEKCLKGQSGLVYSGAGHSTHWSGLNFAGLTPYFLRDIFEALQPSYTIYSAMTLSDGAGTATARDYINGVCDNCSFLPNLKPEFQQHLVGITGNKIGFSKDLPKHLKPLLLLGGDDYRGQHLTDLHDIFIYQAPTTELK